MRNSNGGNGLFGAMGVDDDDDETAVMGKRFPPERLTEFEDFASSGNVYDKLISSFAPSVWELDDVKRGLLCQLFGGSLEDAKKSAAMVRARRQG